MPLRAQHDHLERLYRRYSRPGAIQRDPVRFVHAFDAPADREVAGLVAACLAYGRVEQILRSAAEALRRMGPSPADYLAQAAPAGLLADFGDFRHRVTGGVKFAALLEGIARARAEFGSLDACFASCLDGDGIPAAAGRFVRRLDPSGRCDHLLPDPARGSACKRLWMYLRWMVRTDAIDPGGWRSLRPADLRVPLDTHLPRWSRRVGATARIVLSAACMRGSLESASSSRRNSRPVLDWPP